MRYGMWLDKDMNNTTNTAADQIIPGDKLVIRSSYGDQAHDIIAVWGGDITGIVNIEARNSLGNTFTRTFRPDSIVEVVATDGDR